MIAQFTPFTCVLECVSTYLRELNLPVGSSDMMLNHRDICYNPPPAQHTFGAIDGSRLPELCKRYFVQSSEIQINDLQAVKRILDARQCLLLTAISFRGGNVNHCV